MPPPLNHCESWWECHVCNNEQSVSSWDSEKLYTVMVVIHIRLSSPSLLLNIFYSRCIYFTRRTNFWKRTFKYHRCYNCSGKYATLPPNTFVVNFLWSESSLLNVTVLPLAGTRYQLYRDSCVIPSLPSLRGTSMGNNFTACSRDIIRCHPRQLSMYYVCLLLCVISQEQEQ